MASNGAVSGGNGGGLSDLGGAGGYIGGTGGDGGGGGFGDEYGITSGIGGDGGSFGNGGLAPPGAGNSGGGGGVGGGGGGNNYVGGGGGFGGGGGGGAVLYPSFPYVNDQNDGGGGGFGAGGGGDGPGGFGGGYGVYGTGGGGAGLGGAIFSMDGTVTIRNSTLAGNSAQGGNSNYGVGAIYGSEQGGVGSGYGGGLFNLDGTVTVVDVSIDARNVAMAGASGGSNSQAGNSGGGAIFNDTSGNNADGSTAHATLNLDNAANLAGGVGSNGANAQTATISGSQPTVTIYPAYPVPTSPNALVFNVEFSEPVTGVDASHILLSGTAPGATVAVSGSGAQYMVALSGMLNIGTITASVSAGAARDSAGNESLASNSATFEYNGFSQQGDTVTVTGTPGNDSFSVNFLGAAAIAFNRFYSGLVVTLNGVSEQYTIPFTQKLTIDFNGNGGNDTSVVYGALAGEQVSFSPGAAQIVGPGFAINIEQSATNYVYSTPGGRAEFNASGDVGTVQGPAPNSFVVASGYSYMWGTYRAFALSGGVTDAFAVPTGVDYANFAVGFGSVFAYAYSAADRASLYSSHDATVAMTPAYSYVSTAFADGFSNVYAYSAGDGSDSAYLYDSAAVSTSSPGINATASATGISFAGEPTYSYMSGQFSAGNIANFFNVATGFANVYTVAQGSGDIAYLDSSSSSGDDLLAFADGAAGIRGSRYENVIQGFGLVYATGSTGTNGLDVEGNVNDAPSLPNGGNSPVSYSDGSELESTGFGPVNLYIEASPVAALDFVLQQLSSWSG